CRIVHVEPGQILNEGDVIANLVYDSHTHLNFFMYGDFDLDGNGISSVQDTAAIRRLIEQWGGRVIAIDPSKPAVASLPIEADYVIMGIEPKQPTLSEEDKNDPDKVARAKKLQDAHDAYMAVITRANELGVPIMNQTRFLYYTGY